jgi:hypothetical protein
MKSINLRFIIPAFLFLVLGMISSRLHLNITLSFILGAIGTSIFSFSLYYSGKSLTGFDKVMNKIYLIFFILVTIALIIIPIMVILNPPTF